MWLISFIPESIIHICLILGILGIIVSVALNFLPFVAKYRAAIQIISSVIILIMSWFEGGFFVRDEYEVEALKTKVKIAELEKQVADSEKKAAETNAKVEIVYRDRVQVVKDVQVVVQEKIKDISLKIDSQCQITSETIDILNSAANPSKGVKR